jgi:predicted phosphoribosyltransferase
MHTTFENQAEPYFHDRRHAGSALASELSAYAARADVVVLGLPRGGIPVAFEVALALAAPLDVFVVRKLGWPGHEEYAMGAIASGGVRVLNPDLNRELTLRKEVLDAVAKRELAELERRERLYRADRPALWLRGRCAILVDDGLATGSSMLAAVTALRQHRPARIVVAVPVAAPDACARMRAEADEVICATAPQPFSSVGRWYDDFDQVGDDEVKELLARALVRSSRHSRVPFEAN